MAKVKYIETKPIKQIINFENKQEWYEFLENRINEILNYTYPKGIKYSEYFQYEKIVLNKDGTPRKKINPTWLHTKKAQLKQKKNWAKYQEKRKQQYLERSKKRKLAEIDFKIECLQKEKEELKCLK